MALVALTTLAVVSCTKEKSFEEENGNGGGGGNSDGALLAKIVIQLGPDSATTTFTYDGSNRLIQEANKGLISFNSDDSLMRVTRNTQGIIERVEQIPDPILGDPTVWYVRYNATTKRYTARLTKDSNGNVEDSIAYDYDASGKIVSGTAYVDFGGGVEPLMKETYTYDGVGNLKKVVLSEYDGTAWEEVSEKTMEYDSKTNPLKLAEEAIILDRHQYFGTNNMTKVTIIDYDMPSQSEEITVAYTYNASSKPLTAAIGIPGAGGLTLPATFKYK